MIESREKARILIVDDEIIIAADLERSLSALGYTMCGTVTSGEDALVLVEREAPDLVMMDIVLKGVMDGIEAAQIIREKWGIPIVFLTAYADSDRLERAKLTAPFGYLLKPFNYRDLVVTVEMALYAANVDAERRKAENSLRLSEQRLQALSNASFESIFLSKNGICLDQNLAAERMFGYTRNEAVGRHGAEWIVPSDRDTVKRNILSGYERSYEVTALRKDGSTFPAEIQARMSSRDDDSIRITALRDITDRKNAEKAQKEKEELFSRIFFSSPMSMVITRLSDGACIEINDAFSRSFGYSRKESLGLTSLELGFWLNPEERERVTDLLRKEKSVKDEEIEFRNRSGEVRSGRISLELITISDEQCIVTVIDDITIKKRMEESLRESEKKYRLLADNAGDVIWVRDMDLTLTYVSPSVEAARGYTPEEAKMQTLDEVLTPDSVRTAMETFTQMLEKKEKGEDIPDEYAILLEHRCKDGGTIWMDCKISYLKKNDGDPAGFLGVNRDVTDRKRMEDALRESEERFREMADLSPAVLIEMDATLQISYMNKHGLELFGYTNEEISAGVSGLTIVFPEDRQKINERISSHSDNKILSPSEYRMLKKNQETVWVFFNSSPIYKNDRIVGYRAVMTDVSSRK